MLRVEIIGNLGSDPEQRFTAEGVSMANMRVAVNSRRKGADGEQVERTDWFRVRTMGSKAEYVQRFTKGQRVLVIGRLDIGEYTSRDGEQRTSYDIWADDVINLSPREDGASATVNGANQRAAAPASRQQSGTSSAAAAVERPEDLEDLPF